MLARLAVGSIVLSLCAASSAAAAPILFTTLSGPVSGPPYPTAPILMHVEALFGGTTLPIAAFEIALDQVTSDLGLTLAPGTAVGGIDPEPFLEVAGIEPQPFADRVTINPCFTVDPLGGSLPVLLLPAVIPGADGIFFEVVFDIAVGGGLAHQKVHFAIGAGQPLRLENARLPRLAADGNELEFIFDLVKTSDDPFVDGPLFTMTLSGEFVAVPEPSVLLLAATAAAAVAARSRRGRRA
jgi:hypothetical protein